eukprot:TRINITY_DN3668_c0_g1_i3.p1 TRINITY_DN3668_c0_g1~~TRINITY_DN3668_c0_g1_i3.p1  ORF type:complete len:1846 (-),score=409.18 TRINITY_DN3668_c0_g1_i3:971-6508(-)
MPKLHDALKSGVSEKKFSRLLKDKKVLYSINEQDEENQQCPLHVACSLGLLEQVKALIKKGADCNSQDMNGWTPLHCSASNAHLKLCEHLLQTKGINVQITSIENASVLHYLVRHSPKPGAESQYKRVLSLLLEKGHDVSVHNLQGETPLHSACLRANISAVEFLLENAADASAVNNFGETGLHYAVRNNNAPLVDLLLDYGSDITISGESGQTPVDIAQQYSLSSMLKKLQDYAGVQPLANEEQTPRANLEDGDAYPTENTSDGEDSNSNLTISISTDLPVSGEGDNLRSPRLHKVSEFAHSVAEKIRNRSTSTPNLRRFVRTASGRNLDAHAVRQDRGDSEASRTAAVSPGHRKRRGKDKHLITSTSEYFQMVHKISETSPRKGVQRNGSGEAPLQIPNSNTESGGGDLGSVPADFKNDQVAAESAETEENAALLRLMATTTTTTTTTTSTSLVAITTASDAVDLENPTIARSVSAGAIGNSKVHHKKPAQAEVVQPVSPSSLGKSAKKRLGRSTVKRNVSRQSSPRAKRSQDVLVEEEDNDVTTTTTIVTATTVQAHSDDSDSTTTTVITTKKSRKTKKAEKAAAINAISPSVSMSDLAEQSDNDSTDGNGDVHIAALKREYRKSLPKRATDVLSSSLAALAPGTSRKRFGQRNPSSTPVIATPGRTASRSVIHCSDGGITSSSRVTVVDSAQVIMDSMLRASSPTCDGFYEGSERTTVSAQGQLLLRRLSRKKKMLNDESRVIFTKLGAMLHDTDNVRESQQLLTKTILDPSLDCVSALCDIYSVVGESISIPDIPSLLVMFYEARERATDLLKWAVTKELETSKSPFRTATVYVRLLSAYFFGGLGCEYLRHTILPNIVKLASRERHLEVDPRKAGKGDDVNKNLQILLSAAQEMLDAITRSVDLCPAQFRVILLHAQTLTEILHPDNPHLVSGGLFFLRFICAAIVSPQRYGLISDPPSLSGIRALTLVTKLMQNLANNIEFDGQKEQYMRKLNGFITKNRETFNDFFERLTDANDIASGLSSETRSGSKAPDANEVDAVLYCYLKSRLPAEVLKEMASKEPLIVIDEAETTDTEAARFYDSDADVNDMVQLESARSMRNPSGRSTPTLLRTHLQPDSGGSSPRSVSDSDESTRVSEEFERRTPSRKNSEEQLAIPGRSKSRSSSNTGLRTSGGRRRRTMSAKVSSGSTCSPDASPRHRLAPEQGRTKASTRSASGMSTSSSTSSLSKVTKTDLSAASPHEGTTTPDSEDGGEEKGSAGEREEDDILKPERNRRDTLVLNRSLDDIIQMGMLSNDDSEGDSGNTGALPGNDTGGDSDLLMPPLQWHEYVPDQASNSSADCISPKDEERDQACESSIIDNANNTPPFSPTLYPVSPVRRATRGTSVEMSEIPILQDSDDTEEEGSTATKASAALLQSASVSPSGQEKGEGRILFSGSDDVDQTPLSTRGRTRPQRSNSGYQFSSALIKKMEDVWISVPHELPQKWPSMDKNSSEWRSSLIDIERAKKGDDLRTYRVELGSDHVWYNGNEGVQIERYRDDELFYRDYIQKGSHLHFVGVSSQVGPMIVTVEVGTSKEVKRLKAMVRTRDGTVRKYIPAPGPSSGHLTRRKNKTSGRRAILKALYAVFDGVFEGVNLIQTSHHDQLSTDLRRYEDEQVVSNYKFSVVYCPVRTGGSPTMDDILSVSEVSRDFEEFLDWLGERIDLSGWTKFAGSLDTANNKTGKESVYTPFDGGKEIMFEVVPLLPIDPTDRKQSLRRRHVDDSVVTIVFMDGPNPAPIDPCLFSSGRNHVMAVVSVDRDAERAKQPGTFYRFNFATRANVPPYTPFLPAPPVFRRVRVVCL